MRTKPKFTEAEVEMLVTGLMQIEGSLDDDGESAYPRPAMYALARKLGIEDELRGALLRWDETPKVPEWLEQPDPSAVH